MVEQTSTPGSNADTSINGGKNGASKDRACPFCHQAFTSSSLGRHLDLYIKEKNPKLPDGVHNVDEIRKMRGGITRRQPRSSTSRREDSTPTGTPGIQERRSPPPDSEIRGNESPGLRREYSNSESLGNYGRKIELGHKRTGWEATGVINNIPTPKNVGPQTWDGDDRDLGRRYEGRNRSVSKQVLAKSTFEQKQRLVDALDSAKAAELALRELLGSIRAAKQSIDGPQVFDYDPLSFDFPSLTLHCLPPPPTLYQTSPIPTSTSWSILPPGDQQYQALRSHFSSEFHRWRISIAIATTAPQDDLSYPPPNPDKFPYPDDPAVVAKQAEAETNALESKISSHLQSIFAAWTALPPLQKSEIWTLELARNVGRKSSEIKALKRERDLSQQETAHLKLQLDELNRFQHPREFRLAPPTTIPIDKKVISAAGEFASNYTGIGWNLLDRGLQIDQAVEKYVERWKGVVRDARSEAGGLAAQRSLSGDEIQQTLRNQSVPKIGGISSTNTVPAIPNNSNLTTNSIPNHNPNEDSSLNRPHTAINGTAALPTSFDLSLNPETDPDADGEVELDIDADADADMEDDTFEINDNSISRNSHERGNAEPATNFRLANGNGMGGRMEGLERVTCDGGYVRIGA